MLFHVVVLLRGWLCERAGYLKTLDTLLVRQTALIIAWIDNRESVWWFDGITPASRQILSSKGVCRRRRDIGTMEPDRFNRRSAHTIRGRQQFKEDYTVYKNHLHGCKRKKRKNKTKREEEEWPPGECGCIRPAPCPSCGLLPSNLNTCCCRYTRIASFSWLSLPLSDLPSCHVIQRPRSFPSMSLSPDIFLLILPSSFL